MIVFYSAQLCTMSFDLKKIICIMCVLDPGHPFYLHEFLEDSSLHLPMVVKPPRVSKNACLCFCSLYLWSKRAQQFPLKSNCDISPLTAEPGTSCSAGENQSQIRKWRIQQNDPQRKCAGYFFFFFFEEHLKNQTKVTQRQVLMICLIFFRLSWIDLK